MIPLVLIALFASSDARAATGMWGVGPRIGSFVIPGRFPGAWPGRVADDDALEKVGGDVILGAEGDYWANPTNRFGALAGLDLGADYLNAHLLLKYDRIVPFEDLDGFVGGGAGVSTHRWSSDTEASLKVPAYPLRGEAGVLLRRGSTAWQVLIHAQYDIPGASTYVDAEGEEEDVGWGLYLQMGAELSVLFGDFTPPRRRDDDTRRRRD